MSKFSVRAPKIVLVSVSARISFFVAPRTDTLVEFVNDNVWILRTVQRGQEERIKNIEEKTRENGTKKGKQGTLFRMNYNRYPTYFFPRLPGRVRHRLLW